jgi:histidine phosphotransferase ChpT
MDIDLRVLELACSKLCHDVISPIGAVNNGLELLEEEEDTALKTEALALAQKSARRASVLLQVYRSALGGAGSQQSFGPREALALAGDYFQGGKVQLFSSQPPESTDFPGGFGKLLLNTLIFAGDCLPRGGRIEAQARPPAGSSVPIEVTASGQQLLLSADSARALEGNIAATDLTAQTVLPYIVFALARRLSCDIMVQTLSEPLSISLRIARR